MNKIAIHSVPRSGSTWLGSIFESHPGVIYKYQPLFSYALKDCLTPTSSQSDVDFFFKKLETMADDFMDQQEAKRKGSVPTFEKEPYVEAVVYKEVRYHHILENMLRVSPDVKVIGLVRNPLATLHSWWKAPHEFRGDLGWKFEEEWLEAPAKNANRPEEFNGYLKWKETALLFHKLQAAYRHRFYLLEYAELLNRTDQIVDQLFAFCDLEVTSATHDFINASKGKTVADAYGVYKAKSNDASWVGEMPDVVVEYIKRDLTGTILDKYLR